MKKKISLTAITLSLITSLSLQAAQAPTKPFTYEHQDIFHRIDSEGLKISLTPEGAPTQLVDITTNPLGEDDEDMTVKTLIKAAHKSGRPFCFIVCAKKNAASAPVIVLADDNLHPLTSFPTEVTPLEKYKLYTGGKGSCFSPDFIFEPAPPRVFLQHVPAPYPVAVPVPIRELYPAPYPVFVDRVIETVRREVVTIPYKHTSAVTHDSVPLLFQPSLSSEATQFNEEGTQKLQALLATIQQKSQAITITALSAPKPIEHRTQPNSPNPHLTASSEGGESILRVDRILHPQDADSADLLPIITSVLTSPDDKAPTISPIPKKKRNKKKKQSASGSLAAVSEADEDDSVEQEKSSADLEAQERISQEKKEAELRALAIQEEAEREQEKIRALEAVQKAKEDARLKKIEEDATLQAIKEKREETRKALEKQQKDQRAEQARKDKEIAALKKVEQETAKQQELAQLTAAKKEAQEKAKKMGAAAAIATPKAGGSGKKKGKATAATNDDDGFEKLMAQAAALNAKLPRQPVPSSEKKKPSGLEEAYVAQDVKSEQLKSKVFVVDTDDTVLFKPISQAEKEADMIEKINEAIDDHLYVMAKELLKNINPNSSQYFVFLMDIYINQTRLLTQDEIGHLIANARKIAKDKSVDSWHRCVLYFGLAIHTQDSELKEDFLDKCIDLDRDEIHLRAKVLKKKIVLTRHDAANAVCKTRNGECLHKETFLYVRALEASDLFFVETILLKIKFLVKALSAPESCWQLTSIMKSLEIEPRKTLIEYYDTKVRQSDHTAEELAEINSLIPADFIPTHELHRLE